MCFWFSVCVDLGSVVDWFCTVFSFCFAYSLPVLPGDISNRVFLNIRACMLGLWCMRLHAVFVVLLSVF